MRSVGVIVEIRSSKVLKFAETSLNRGDVNGKAISSRYNFWLDVDTASCKALIIRSLLAGENARLLDPVVPQNLLCSVVELKFRFHLFLLRTILNVRKRSGISTEIFRL